MEYSAPGENEVTVRLEYSAISTGTEKANFVGMRPGIFIAEDAEVEFPRYVGYSDAGIVEAVGSGVTDLKVGDSLILSVYDSQLEQSSNGPIRVEQIQLGTQRS